jgi:5-methylthioadenosine/S-adenosylhomocysteine deaminase
MNVAGRIVIDPDNELTYGLQGTIVTMNANFDIIKNGIIWISKGNILKVTKKTEGIPAEFVNAKVIQTGGTLFPGLIELHNHISYNILPMWLVPRIFKNRNQWSGNYPPYRQLITKPMEVIANSPGFLEAIIRFVESKCLIGGVTTTQGITLSSRGDIKKYYKGMVRNVENTGETDLPFVHPKISDVAAKDILKFKKELDRASTLLLHLSEGIDARARKNFENLKLPGGEWAISDHLGSIHCNALGEADIKIMKENGASIIWSPLSNLLLYGKTADIKSAVRESMQIAIGSDWSPTGSKNLFHELKIAYAFAKQMGVLGEKEIVAMGTSIPAKIIKWDKKLGSLEAGKKADIIIMNFLSGNPYKSFLESDETKIGQVIINGIPRYGEKKYFTELILSEIEGYDIGNKKHFFYFRNHQAEPVVINIGINDAISLLSDGLKNIPHLAKEYDENIRNNSRHPGMMGIQGTTWQLVLDHDDAETGTLRRNVNKRKKVVATLGNTSDILKDPMELDVFSVANDKEKYFELIRNQNNLPDFIKQEIPGLYK